MTTLQPERNRMDSAAQPAATSDLRFMFPPGLSLRFERRCQEYDEEDLFLKMIISGWSAKRRFTSALRAAPGIAGCPGSARAFDRRCCAATSQTGTIPGAARISRLSGRSG